MRSITQYGDPIVNPSHCVLLTTPSLRQVPIGRPVLNTALLLLRYEGTQPYLAKDDMMGEIAVLGSSVCAGYHRGNIFQGDKDSFLRLSSVRIDEETKGKAIQDFLTALESKSERRLTKADSLSDSVTGVNKVLSLESEVGRLLENNTKRLMSFIRSKSHDTRGSVRSASESPKKTSSLKSPNLSNRVRLLERQWSKNSTNSPPRRDTVLYRTGDYGKV